jgi:hypothetical protein
VWVEGVYKWINNIGLENWGVHSFTKLEGVAARG